MFYLRDLLSPTEKILLEQDQVVVIQETRDLLMKTLIPEIRAYITLIAGMQIREFYYDWGLHNYSGVFVGIESNEAGSEFIERLGFQAGSQRYRAHYQVDFDFR